MQQRDIYLDKILELEESGDFVLAVALFDEAMKRMPAEEAFFLYERGKFQFRNANYQEALTDFIYAYQISNDPEIYELVLEAYLYPNQENLILQYQENLKLLENYPHYKNEYPQEELHFYPIFQSDEMVACVDTQSRTFAIDHRKEIKFYPEHDTCYMMFNELWSEDIIKCEEKSRLTEPFMDMNIPMYLVYDRLYWILSLQLYDFSGLIDTGRIVFLIGQKVFCEYLLDTQVIMPNRIQMEQESEYLELLKKIAYHKDLEYRENKQKIAEYYAGREAEIDEHIRSGKPRILFLTSRFTTILQYHTRDCMEYAKRLGCETRLMIEKDGIFRTTNYDTQKVLLEFKPDIVFCIDHYRAEYQDIPAELVWVTWIQDALPQSTLDQEIVDKTGKRDVVFSMFISDLCGKQWKMNYKDVLEMPVPVNTRLYHNWELSSEERNAYACDICIIANGTDYWDEIEDYLRGASVEVAESCKAVIEVYMELMKKEKFYYGAEENYQLIQYIANELQIPFRESFLRKLSDEISMRIYYRRYKSLVAEWLIDAGFTNLKLYGNEWANNEKFVPYAMGVIENGEKLSKALNSAKISIGLHPHVSLPSKLLESISSGTLYIAHHIPQEHDLANAREYFEEDKELLYYYSKQDLVEKVDYYLQHEAERQKIIEAGQRRIREDLTYEQMIKKMIEETAKKLES